MQPLKFHLTPNKAHGGRDLPATSVNPTRRYMKAKRGCQGDKTENILLTGLGMHGTNS